MAPNCPGERRDEHDASDGTRLDPMGDVGLALTSLPSMGLPHLIQICRLWSIPDLVRALRGGLPVGTVTEDVDEQLPAVTLERLDRWRRELEIVDVEALHRRYERSGVAVLVRGGPGYPARLGDDELTAPVLFARGDLALLERSSVAVVGTRTATRLGMSIARSFAEQVTDRGHAVVSGLALGIDGAAHEGALAAKSGRAPGPVGVVASGLDVCYPRRHERLWSEVTRRGLMISTAPLGGRPGAHLFPKRNRVIAGLGCITLVVESHRTGGSLHTARAAADFGRIVLACPAALDNMAGDGVNALLANGSARLCRDVNDIFLALGQTVNADRGDSRPDPSVADAPVLTALGWEPTSLDALVTRTGRPLGLLVLALARLEAERWIQRVDGRWQRIGRVL